ncbi:MAG: hypothetical protein ACKVQW_15625 [Pyrinomonadaceae bacterium]
MSKDFLNAGILGANISAAGGRGFRPINTDNLPIPEYDGRYFETFPTVWANAYAFRKELEMESQIAIGEWITLFLLHYFGVLHLENFDQKLLQKEFDRDLWLAFSGTYPRSRDEADLQSIGILRTSGPEGAVVGAYYPQIIFFPSRGRESWASSESLKPYLENNRLSWSKASALLLESDYYKSEFHAHLRAIPNVLPRRELKERMEAFCDQIFGAFYGQTKAISPHPGGWDTRIPKEISAAELLREYPLQRGRNKDGGKTYYLLTGLDLSYQPPWMKTKISPELPAPVDFMQSGPRQITVEFAGKKHVCALEEGDEIVLLKDLFLAHPPFFCKVPRETDTFANRVSFKHEVALQDNTIRPQEKAVCLAPLQHIFFQHFREIFQEMKTVRSEPTPDGGVQWSFGIWGEGGLKEQLYEVYWKVKPILLANLASTNTLSIYPPKVSPQWKLYVAHGTGNKETSGRWHLIDENGWLATEIDLEEEEYVSILHREGDAPNRPKAMLFKDAAGKERGIMFLAELDNVDLDSDQTATLAVDFGTSNTCVAVKARKAEVLDFSLSPLPIWGPTSPAENPGFVPKKWGGQRGFFPTILLSRRFDDRLPAIEPEHLLIEHLFKVDIPSLHKGINDRFASGVFNKDWRTHSNLKWNTDTRTPWRSLFLELILLYTHAEVFFKRSAKLEKYVFTYPLAFSADYGDTYHNKAQEAIRKVRHYCYGEDRLADVHSMYNKVDESTAIARSTNSEGMRGRVEVFIDIGGGTADMAIRHQNEFLVLDSLRVAGRSFFQFAKKNFDQNTKLPGALDFRKNMSRVIRGKAEDLDLTTIESDLAEDLGAFYAVEVNELDESMFQEREENVLKQRMGKVSYQRYRSRLFFYHVLTYALLQSCATVIDQKIVLNNGLNLILGGNGWGLLLFAELQRKSSVLMRESKEILALLKERLSKTLTDEEKPFLDKIYIESVDLLNQDSLSSAKTSVALGALFDGSKNTAVADTSAYAGMTIKDMEINGSAPKTIRWCDRWSYDAFRDIFGRFTDIKSRSFAQPDELKEPIDDTLGIFTAVGNTSSFGKDHSPEGFWMKLNSQIVKSLTDKLQTEGERLNLVPINYFLSEILYPTDSVSNMLDKLAESNLNSDGNGGG